MEQVPFRHWVVARAEDDHTAIRFEDRSWSYREAVRAGAERAAFMLARRRAGPLHVGVVLENVPEFWWARRPVPRSSCARRNASKRWECDEPVWFRPGRQAGLRRRQPSDVQELRAAFAARGRESRPV